MLFGTEELSLVSYVMRVFLALAVMAVLATFFVGLAKNRGWVRQDGAHVKIMASLPLGKDVFFVLRCGPDVLALTSGQGGTRLLGRWKYEEWLRLEDNREGAGKPSAMGEEAPCRMGPNRT
ncbi:MAG: hypothetical protein LBC93_02355 [Synergistaceae bacterium]|jgi:hypothetical protein|nr:hypothetical protein [Synergistaceae bacterium]